MTYRDACKRGHPMVEGSYYWRADGSRICRICYSARRSAAGKARRAKLRAEAVSLGYTQDTPDGETVSASHQGCPKP